MKATTPHPFHYHCISIAIPEIAVLIEKALEFGGFARFLSKALMRLKKISKCIQQVSRAYFGDLDVSNLLLVSAETG